MKNFTDIKSLIEEGYLDSNGKYNGNGFNLDAINDILRGGFGVFESGEKLKVIFKHFEIAEKNLNIIYNNMPFIYWVLRIFVDHSFHIDFELECN